MLGVMRRENPVDGIASRLARGTKNTHRKTQAHEPASSFAGSVRPPLSSEAHRGFHLEGQCKGTFADELTHS